MGLFIESEGDTVIVVERGVYKQVPLYTRDGHLYAKTAGGFVRLYADGATTKTNCRMEQLVTDLPLAKDRFGKLCTTAVADSVPLEGGQKNLLLGVA